LKLLFLRVLCVLCGSFFRYLCVSPDLNKDLNEMINPQPFKKIRDLGLL
jgi:hypothetical protein